MDLMQTLREQAAAKPMRVAFPEGENETMMQAVAKIAAEHLAECVLVGDGGKLKELADGRGISLDGIEIVDVTALILQVLGDVDVMFAGIDNATGDIILAGQTIVGLADGVDTVSSCGIADIPNWNGGEGGLLAFGDSAVCVDPTSEELASIAISSSETVRSLTGWDIRCALLSHSTDGSMDNELVDKVRRAREIANDRRPDLAIDGEFQFDSAINPKVAAKKVHRESAVAGQANVVIWPDINVGNIGVKIIQNLTGANAYGPMLQGFKKIVCDCSRSAPVDEIVGNVVMSCVRAQALKEA